MAERWEFEGLGRSDEGDVVGERRKRCDAERPLFRDRGLANGASLYSGKARRRLASRIPECDIATYLYRVG